MSDRRAKLRRNILGVYLPMALEQLGSLAERRTSIEIEAHEDTIATEQKHIAALRKRKALISMVVSQAACELRRTANTERGRPTIVDDPADHDAA